MDNTIELICIDNRGINTNGLTLGETYIAKLDNVKGDLPIYYIINDFGKGDFFQTSRFLTKAEWREKQINSILDD